DRHLEWYLALAEQSETELLGSEQAMWLTRLEEEHDNLRVALARSLTGVPGRSPVRRGLGKGNQPSVMPHDGAGRGRSGLPWSEAKGSPIPDGEGASALRMAAALVRFWERRGHMSDARQWLAQALAAGQSAPAGIRAKALRSEGSLAYFQGDYAAGRLRMEESLALYRGLGDTRSAADVQGSLGRVVLRQGEHAAARAHLEASLAVHVELDHTPGIAGVGGSLGLLALREGDHVTARAYFEGGLALQRRLGNVEGIAEALEDLATVAGEQGEHEEQIALLEESLALFYQLGSKGGIALVLGNLGIGAWLQGDAGRATALLRESLALYQELGDRRGVARLLGNQSFLALSQRDYARALTLGQESLALYRASGDAWGIGRYLPVLAGAAFGQGQPERAARLYAAAQALRQRLGTPLPALIQVHHDRAVTAVRRTLGDDAFAAAWRVGEAMPVDEALDDAQSSAAP
ncbi:MAG: tetratricopeptide repeat protein, partial [Dehalococcoidia bacterium]